MCHVTTVFLHEDIGHRHRVVLCCWLTYSRQALGTTSQIPLCLLCHAQSSSRRGHFIYSFESVRAEKCPCTVSCPKVWCEVANARDLQVLRKIYFQSASQSSLRWFRGLTVMTADSDSASEGSTPSETYVFESVSKWFWWSSFWCWEFLRHNSQR